MIQKCALYQKVKKPATRKVLGCILQQKLKTITSFDKQKLEFRNSIEEASQEHFTEEDTVEQIEANSNKYHSSPHPEEAGEINDAIEFAQNV